MSYTKLFNWLTDLVRNEKIVAARLDAEFDAISVASNHINITQVNNDTSTVGELDFNEINVTSNTKVTPGTPSTEDPFSDNVAAGLKVTMTEGTNAGGFQIPGLFRLNHNVATSIWDSSAASDHIVVVGQGHSDAADNSNGGEGAGFYGANFALWLESGAKHQHAVGINSEIVSEVGVTVQNRVGFRSQSESFAGAGARGVDLDAAYTVVCITHQRKDGIVFGEPNGFTGAPLHTSGSIMRSAVAMTITDIFGFGNLTVTGNILNTPNVLITGAGAVSAAGNIATNAAFGAGGTGVGTGSLILAGVTSGAVTIKPQAAAGTYNWNLPTSAGTSGDVLISGGGGSTAMTWRSPIYGTFYKSSDQTYTASAVTKVLINTAETNQGLTFDGVTNNRVTIITAGRYYISASVYINGVTNGGDLVTGRIKKNGTTDLLISLVPATTSPAKEGIASDSKVVSLAANDYLELFASAQTNGTIGGLATVTFMSLHYIGP